MLLRMTDAEFYDRVRLKCVAAGVRFVRSETETVSYSDSMKVAGYFDDGEWRGGPPELAFAAGRPDSLEILLHESCHMDQFLEDDPLWDACADSSAVLDEWLGGEDHDRPTVVAAVSHLVAIELDCERRSIAKAGQMGLGIDLGRYVKKANGYLYFYAWVRDRRTWCAPGYAPYQIDGVLELCPSALLTPEQYLAPPKEVMDAMDRFVKHA